MLEMESKLLIKFNQANQPPPGTIVHRGNATGIVRRPCDQTKGCEVKIIAARDHHQIGDIVIWNFAKERTR